MASAEKSNDQAHQEDLLALTHEAELDLLTRQYDERISAFNADYAQELSALRHRSAHALAKIVAEFEKRRAASKGRFMARREMLRHLGFSPLVVGKA